MQLAMDTAVAPSHYKSPARISGIVAEKWATQNMYCCACPNDVLEATPTNQKAFDFICRNCQATYQLKSRNKYSKTRVQDASYDTMIEAIKSGNTPNLLLMHYSNTWQVQNLMLVPRFFFNETAIHKRNPLGPNAKRAGWVGCTILLSQIVAEGKLYIVENGVAATADYIREEYKKVRPLEVVPIKLRGWGSDVFVCVLRLNKTQFSLHEMYKFEEELAALHPTNNKVREKIRQQLQKLRDAGLLEFLGRGQYRLLA